MCRVVIETWCPGWLFGLQPPSLGDATKLALVEKYSSMAKHLQDAYIVPLFYYDTMGGVPHRTWMPLLTFVLPWRRCVGQQPAASPQ